MHYDVTSCVICISNNVEHLEKEGSYKNSTKDVTLSLHCQVRKKSSELIKLEHLPFFSHVFLN